jgi:hypothetical protein
MDQKLLNPSQMKIIMKLTLLPIQVAVLFMSLLSISALHANEVLWQSDLASLSVGSNEGFRPETTIVEEAGQRFISKKDAESEVFFSEATRGAANWINYRSTVRFRYHEKNCSMIIAVKFRGGGREEADYLWYYIGVNNTELQTSTQHLKDKEAHIGDPRAGSKEALLKTFMNIPPGEWITFSVDVGEKVLKVRVALDSGETAEWEFPAFAGMGGTQIVARQPVDISKFVVEQLAAPVLPTK